MNKLLLIGNIGKDPEIINLESGKQIAKFSIATSKNYKNQSGEKITETEWHNVVAFGKVAGVVEKHFTKGMKIFVEGELKTRTWEDKEGNTRYNTDVIMNGFEFLGGKSENSTPQNNNQQFEPAKDLNDDDYDDLPF